MNKTIPAAIIFAASAFAQEPVVIEMQKKVALIGAEMLPEQTVTGAPFSAEETTTTTQMLLDGNRIVNESATKVYRDDQGRTRVEHTLGNIGSLPTEQPGVMVTINDPVSNTRFTLETGSRTAYKMAGAVNMPAAVDKLLAEHRAMATTEARRSDTNLFFTTTDSSGPQTMIMKQQLAPPGKTEDLGASNMAGVQVKGTRTTTVIPAGAAGNERDINIVSERWYSPELKMNIMTKRSDPRFGDTVFQVNSLTRGNPDASLFQVPAGYQVKENSKGALSYKFVTKD